MHIPDETLEFLEDWNGNNFWEYFPWVGLQYTTEFTAQIGSNLSLNELYEAYYDMSQSFGCVYLIEKCNSYNFKYYVVVQI